jgi:hypothetical protein
LHLPAPSSPLGGTWSKFAKALPPAGRNLPGELVSPGPVCPTSALHFHQHDMYMILAWFQAGGWCRNHGVAATCKATKSA